MRKPQPPSVIPAIGEGKRGEDGYLGYLLRQAANAQRRRMDQTLAGLDLTQPQFVVLTMLKAYPGSSNADVARLAMLTPQTVHGIVEILKRQGLLGRQPHPVHGRIQNIELTAAGCDLLDQARARVLVLEAQLKEAMSEEDAAIIRRWLVSVARDPS